MKKAIYCYNIDDVDQHILELSLIHISEPTRQAEISYAVFCLKKKKKSTKKEYEIRSKTNTNIVRELPKLAQMYKG